MWQSHQLENISVKDHKNSTVVSRKSKSWTVYCCLDLPKQTFDLTFHECFIMTNLKKKRMCLHSLCEADWTLFALCLTKYLSWKKRISQHTKESLFEKVQRITEIGVVGFFFLHSQCFFSLPPRNPLELLQRAGWVVWDMPRSTFGSIWKLESAASCTLSGLSNLVSSFFFSILVRECLKTQ